MQRSALPRHFCRLRRAPGLSPSTLGRIFKKRNLFLPKIRAKGLRRLARKRERPDKALRKAFPGSLVQTDTKHLRFSDGTKVYQFTAIDTLRLRSGQTLHPPARPSRLLHRLLQVGGTLPRRNPKVLPLPREKHPERQRKRVPRLL
jgi:hypothetical protein